MFTTVAQRPNLPRNLRDQFRVANGRRVDAHLLGAGLDESGGVVQRADAAADGERHEALPRVTRRTMSSRMSRPSWLAEMSRKTSSSAPSLRSVGRPRRGRRRRAGCSKWIPLTTRPRSTSRQGMIRLVSIGGNCGPTGNGMMPARFESTAPRAPVNVPSSGLKRNRPRRGVRRGLVDEENWRGSADGLGGRPEHVGDSLAALRGSSVSEQHTHHGMRNRLRQRPAPSHSPRRQAWLLLER